MRCVAIKTSTNVNVGECWGYAFGKVVHDESGYDASYIKSRVTAAETANVGSVSFTTDAMSEFGNGCCRLRTQDPVTGEVTVKSPGNVVEFSEYDSLATCKQTCLAMPTSASAPNGCQSFDVKFPKFYGGKVKCWFFGKRPDRVLCSPEQRCYKREQQIVSFDLNPLLAANGHTLTGGDYKYVFNVGQDLQTPPDSSCTTTETYDPLTGEMTEVKSEGTYAMGYQFPIYQNPDKPWCHRISGSAYDNILPSLTGGKPQYIGCRDTLPLGASSGEVSDITAAVFVQSPSECKLKCDAKGFQFMMLECPNPKGIECRCVGESAIGKITDADCSGSPTTQLPPDPATGAGGEPGSASNDHTNVNQGSCAGFQSSFTFGAEKTASGADFALGGWHRGALYALRSNLKWSLIDDTNPQRGVVLEMEGGDVCKGSGGETPVATAARSLRIAFQCESNTEPLPHFETVTEDNFCQYSFTLQTIYGCPTQCAKTDGKICNDVGKCAWDHGEEAVRCACTDLGVSDQHNSNFGPYCDQVCKATCTSATNHGFCEFDTDANAARCFCNTGWEGTDCSVQSAVPQAQGVNVPGVTPAAGAAIGVLVPVICIFVVLFGILLGALFWLGRHLKNVKLDPNVYRDPMADVGPDEGQIGTAKGDFGLGGYIAPSFF
jgi:hypothetical protein